VSVLARGATQGGNDFYRAMRGVFEKFATAVKKSRGEGGEG